MNRLDDMIAFIRIVELRSFTAAAERLGMSKSVISRRMTDLENRLGARLINRTTRRLAVTEVGQAFYERAVRIVGDIEEAEQAVANLHGEPRGILRINAPMSFGMRHLAPAIAVFLEHHPKIRIEMDLNDRFVDVIEEGYDMAVRIGRLRDSSLIARKLAPSHVVICASPGYVERYGEPVTPADLERRRCLLYTNVPASEQWQFVPRSGSGPVQRVRADGSLKVNNGDVLAQAAISGLGIVVLPTFIVGEALSGGLLRTLLPDYALQPSAVHAVYPHNRHLSAKVRSFVDFLAGRFGPAPYWDAALFPP